MNRLFAFILIALVAVGARAQKADIRKAAERYKTMNTLVTDVTQTRHNANLTGDIVTAGKFYFRKPEQLAMLFAASGEQLVATGGTFGMKRDGRVQTIKAQGKGNNPFETLREVFGNLLSADDDAQLSDMADVRLSKEGNTVTITITPVVTDPKAKRRMMFTSCIVTVDLKTAELRSLRINERGTNYTQYDFANYSFNAAVPDTVFDL